GYGMGKQNADIVTLSGDARGANLGAIRPEFQTIDGPGEYEMHDVFVTGTRTYQDDSKGTEHGYNTTYVIEVEGIKIGHLGNIGHSLTEAQSETFEDIDVLLMPVGSDEGFTYDKAVEFATELTPKVLIPMRYATTMGDKTLGDLDAFCKKLGIEVPEAEDKFTFKASDLGETTRLIVLKPDSDAAKR
ncbi:MAG: MBL fold metallo-hydrolase, partial [Chloroflexota bacterium]|nr:MBL fold metallo-hydrolase [Chloroflexota bacterium]